ncbi:EAL and modified HD-GYP domain-containing signal transduction protein [Maridesulfovibrio ferrireducens]|uniref:EAL and modified HD-GYP domain-containing signal transduction protein n=1 Tax=Maridesulfovibrio ferrireducens TaxID=246191 RepID=A0A1G9IZV0_9BACT|nr:HDOD domain-containing protein [Maridesulfovibrio ferrireducens]SDL30635.1 EAL and modified HD-GYP domain-containing signal transduction protein [Maridesulfovibrio ferrireducens]
MAITNTPLYDQIFFARQPILQPDQSLWGYELFFRNSSSATTAIISDDYKATLNVAADSCSIPGEELPGDVKLVINFSHKSIIEKIPYSLPAKNTVVQIPEMTPPTPNLIKALQDLSKDGYTVAIDDFEGRPQGDILIKYADVVIVDIKSANEDQLHRIHCIAQKEDVKLIAKRVEDMSHYQLAQKFGFAFFQGFYFKRPENIAGRKLRPSEVVKLKLFKLIEDPAQDFEALAEALQNDVSICYRLLTLLNSPTFGFSQKITSIKQAIVLAGWKLIKNWLRVILLTDLISNKKSTELPQLATQRAKFLEMVTIDSHHNIPAESMFLLGLFSLLGAMFDMPMNVVTKYLPLDEDLRAALCGEDNIYRKHLELIDHFEAAQWDQLEETIIELGLNPVSVSRNYYDSMRWANSFFQTPGSV